MFFELVEYVHDPLKFFFVGKGNADFAFSFSRARELYLGVEEVGESLLEHSKFDWHWCLCNNLLPSTLDVLTVFELLGQFFYAPDGITVLLRLFEEFNLQ